MESQQGACTLELELEVGTWREGLPVAEQAQADYHITLLAEQGVLLGAPYTSQIRRKLRELRFYCGGRRVILLTVFDKQRRRERAEVDRAYRAMERCVEEGHAPEEHESYGESRTNGRSGNVERGP